MIVEYLVLAIVLVVTLNHRNRIVRAAGSLLAAIGLAFIVLSVYLADTDGTFAGLPPGSVRPILLNLQAAIALMAIVLLLWASWRQLHRRLTADVPWRNTRSTYGHISRGAHPAGYAVIILLPVTGLLLTMVNGIPLDLYGWAVPHPTLRRRQRVRSGPRYTTWFYPASFICSLHCTWVPY